MPLSANFGQCPRKNECWDAIISGVHRDSSIRPCSSPSFISFATVLQSQTLQSQIIVSIDNLSLLHPPRPDAALRQFARTTRMDVIHLVYDLLIDIAQRPSLSLDEVGLLLAVLSRVETPVTAGVFRIKKRAHGAALLERRDLNLDQCMCF